MKTLQTLIALLIFATCGYAQTPLAENIPTGSIATSEKAGKEPVRGLTSIHNQSVIAQLTQHLVSHIEYPATMVNSGIGGQMIVRVSISEKGQVTRPQIVQSVHPEFDRAVLKALKTINTIQIKEGRYQGLSVVNVPINFHTTP